ETMLQARVSAVFVFDANHALTGVLSAGDLLRHSGLGAEPKHPYWLELLLGSGRAAESYTHVHGRKAGEVMTRDVETIGEDAELSEAVDRMIRRRVKRLPVVRGDAVVGVVARSDLLRALLATNPQAAEPHSDADIKAAILAARDKLDWAPRGRVGVEGLRAGLRVVAETAPGCVAVHDHIAWIEPNSGTGIPSPEDEDKSS